MEGEKEGNKEEKRKTERQKKSPNKQTNKHQMTETKKARNKYTVMPFHVIAYLHLL